MNEYSPEDFEAELRQFTPATPPADLMARLVAAEPKPTPSRAPEPVGFHGLWIRLRWWLAPATAVVICGLGLVHWQRRPALVQPQPAAVVRPMAVKADDVRIERELLTAFDAVARLPSGEAVRFRCREWVDDVRLHDRTRGVVVERRTPRVEVVPVRFETY